MSLLEIVLPKQALYQAEPRPEPTIPRGLGHSGVHRKRTKQGKSWGLEGNRRDLRHTGVTLRTRLFAKCFHAAVLATGVAALALSGCAPIAWQPPAGAPPEALSMDDAACRLTARGMDPGYQGPYYGTLGQAAGHALGDEIATAIAQRADYKLCMKARGYQEAGAAQ